MTSSAHEEGDRIQNAGYALLTAVRNELGNLQTLRDSVFGQSHKPCIWTIVDSGSTDGTYEALKSEFGGIDWIHLHRQRRFPEQGYGHRNFAQAINEAYSEAQRLADERDIAWTYIGKTDATPILPAAYFETLITEMERNPKLAVVCGYQNMVLNRRIIRIRPRDGIPLSGFNDIRLYRKTFFEMVGGYPISYAPDTVILLRAVRAGWQVQVTDKTIFEKRRLGGSSIGVWKGYMLKGEAMHYLGYHPLLMLANALDYSMRYPPHYQGLPIVAGFLRETARRSRRIEDEYVLNHFGRARLKSIFDDRSATSTEKDTHEPNTEN